VEKLQAKNLPSQRTLTLEAYPGKPGQRLKAGLCEEMNASLQRRYSLSIALGTPVEYSLGSINGEER